VEGEEEVPSGLLCGAFVGRHRARRATGPFGYGIAVTHDASPRRARVTAERTTGSESPDALARESRAEGCRIRASPNAALARHSAGSPFPSHPFAFRIRSRRGTPSAPAIRPYASRNATFSTRSASLIAFPVRIDSKAG